MQFTSFQPTPRTLMGPGPSDVHPRVLAALSRPTIGHLDPEFIGMMDQVKALLQYAFQTSNDLTMAVSAPGSAGMETCFVNLIEPGETVIVCVNGVFGTRMVENVERIGAIAIVVEDEWGQPVDPEKVKQAFMDNPQAVCLAFVHAETSTGALSDAETLCQLAQDNDALSIVDAVTSLGGVDVNVDAWGIDAIYSGSQKCLSSTPGISPVSFSPKAVDKLKQRKTRVPSWFLDQSLLMNYWNGEGKRSYHHTAPVNALYGLHEALLMLKTEGLNNAFNRHRQQHEQLKAGLSEMEFQFLVDEPYRLPQLNTILIPQGIDDAAVRAKLLNDYNLEIGAGLGPYAGKVWRIGLMGYAARNENVLLCLAALKKTLSL